MGCFGGGGGGFVLLVLEAEDVGVVEMVDVSVSM